MRTHKQPLADLQMLESSNGATGIQTWAEIEPSWQTRIEQATAPESTIAGMVSPSTEQDLADLVSIAHRQRWRMLPCGAGSKLDWGGLVRGADVVVSTQRLNRLIDHAIGDLTVTVEAGYRFADLQALLATAGQFVAIDPTYPDMATIGGMIATADTGSLRQRYNSVRDMLLGLSFIRADGKLAKAGGRVVKNVAGYDLMKLFTGSYGTLGIISQVTLRVYPLPENSQTVVLSGDVELIAQAATTLLSSGLTPVAADILSASVVHQLAIGQGLGLAIRFQSILPSVQAQTNRLLQVGQTLGLNCSSFVDADDTALWQSLPAHMTARHPNEDITCKIGVEPSAAASVLTQLEELPVSTWSGQIHAASGLGRLVFHDPTIQPETLLQVRQLCQANRGFLTILQAPTALKQTLDVWGYTGNALDLMRQLKQQFDPYALLSPQRFVRGV